MKMYVCGYVRCRLCMYGRTRQKVNVNGKQSLFLRLLSDKTTFHRRHHSSLITHIGERDMSVVCISYYFFCFITAAQITVLNKQCGDLSSRLTFLGVS